MNQKQINRIIKLLRNKGVSFDKGLSNEEILRVENKFKIQFPPDLKLFLQTQLPASKSFVHWRYGINSEKGKNEIENRFNWPVRGILFDIKNNSFWLEKWGLKPKSSIEQIEIATNELLKKPKLIPIYSHRYISSSPYEIGNPVFSVYQKDIIYYGNDLANYFANEFRFDLPESFGKIAKPKRINFWSEMIELNF